MTKINKNIFLYITLLSLFTCNFLFTMKRNNSKQKLKRPKDKVALVIAIERDLFEHCDEYDDVQETVSSPKRGTSPRSPKEPPFRDDDELDEHYTRKNKIKKIKKQKRNKSNNKDFGW